jgi:nucleoside 2-deoxyribosyltransferase
MKRTIYIAAPLFSKSERDFNLILNKFLENLGFNTFLPQRDGHLLSELVGNGSAKDEAIQKIFQKDSETIKNCDLVVFVMDGRVPDEGACVEIGLAFAYDKECFGLKTDSRSLMDDMDNPLIVGALKGRIAKSFPELELLLKPLTRNNFSVLRSQKSSSDECITAD